MQSTEMITSFPHLSLVGREHIWHPDCTTLRGCTVPRPHMNHGIQSVFSHVANRSSSFPKWGPPPPPSSVGRPLDMKSVRLSEPQPWQSEDKHTYTSKRTSGLSLCGSHPWFSIPTEGQTGSAGQHVLQQQDIADFVRKHSSTNKNETLVWQMDEWTN